MVLGKTYMYQAKLLQYSRKLTVCLQMTDYTTLIYRRLYVQDIIQNMYNAGRSGLVVTHLTSV